MDRSTRTSFSGLVAILALILFTLPRPSLAKSVAYCSSQNTGDGAAKFWTWQSNGWCNDNCKGTSAFGVILENNCWCSDFIPDDQVDISDCSDSCPGFPEEKCGNKDEGLYIYVRLDSNVQPSGTKGTSKPTSSSVSPSSSANSVTSRSSAEAPPSSSVMTPSSAPPSPIPSSSAALPDPETIVQTVTASASVVTVTPNQPSAVSTTLTTTAGPTSSSDTSSVTNIQLITLSGVVITQTVVTTPTSVPTQTNQGQSKKSTNVGAIVGGVIGGLALLGAIVGALIFFFFRRRRQQEDEDESGVRRNTSTMSKSGLIGGGEKAPRYPPRIATNFNSRNSRALDNESISPVSGSDRRSSRLVFDQRLNPSAIMVLDNASRGSFASLDDSHDYGRTLNVRNPDPDTR
ncbi:hypothetical protein K505DRAFT_27793 [Melanomma pulvis-pyrius CBS 109.77]|uniref:WSC domain-containing protein n=1 Tax=Melanomma pulvis-pyrius CBS 109.77 TaxID=1314802 RepID=A0A6A6XEA1_9PLEO|nr:hypothetical protein K505DRAFT_27793 [Melanomma pulvis-pyrius CBS 109.77]